MAVYLDFEFNSYSEPEINVVCGSYIVRKNGVNSEHNFWLNGANPKEHNDFVESLIAEGHTFFSYYVPAEARSLHSLGIDPRRINWVDLATEYRMIMNCNHKYNTGKHLVKGVEKIIYPAIPKWERTDADPTSTMAEVSLVSCCYKFLGININAEHKDQMRDLILSGKDFTKSERKDIMDYCMSDVIHLPELFQRMYKAIYYSYESKDRKNLKREMLLRGEYGARTAVMESVGYPINYESTRSFSLAVKPMLYQLQKEITTEFSDISPFLANKSGTAFVQKQKNIRGWISDQGHENWMPTDKGELSLSLQAFERYYSHKGDQTNFGNRFTKYLHTKQSLNGFMPAAKGQTIWDFTGSDERVRPWFGIFRAQTSRSQPKATSYIPLKAKWMRVLIEPTYDRAIVGIDYSQQEFLIAGLLSQDENMIQAYESGDVYLHFGKQAGLIPKHGTKEEYSDLRDKCKSTVLGIQYLMGAKGLSEKLTKDTGVWHSEDEAQDLIDKFNEVYEAYSFFRDETWDEYLDKGYLKLPCGWTIYGDNSNRRSVCNFPIQGTGASIMRKGVAFAQDENLDVILTLHDALYIECFSDEVPEHLETLAKCMDYAFKFYFFNTSMEPFANCRMDATVWSPDFRNQVVDTYLGPVKFQDKYLEPRAIEDYNKYSKYFLDKEELDLLTKF